jgi:AcrR family transcriptional regulator
VENRTVTLHNQHDDASLVKGLHFCEDASRRVHRSTQEDDLVTPASTTRTTTPPAGDGGPSRRERARAATVEEIKTTAVELMRDQGTTEVRFTDIARVMGMTPPALYRYFGDRDELLTVLIADAYRDLGRFIAEQRDAVDEEDIEGRWVAAATAYRDWARTEPQQFALILGLPVPGYVAPEEGPTTDAAKDAMNQLSVLFISAAAQGKLGQPLIDTVDPAVQECASDKHPELDGVTPPATFQSMIHAWATLHGITCLDAWGQLDWLSDAARDALFVSSIRTAAKAAGIGIA